MNIFLHQLDVQIQALLTKEARIWYVRYADDMLIAIQKGAHSERFCHNFGQFFRKALKKLQLKATSIELKRPRKILVLVVSIGSTGILERKAPLKCWK